MGIFFPGKPVSLCSELPHRLVLMKAHCSLLCIGLISLVAQMVRSRPAMQETWVRSLDWEDPLEKETATHSSIPAWEIPRTEEPGRLQSMGLQRVRHDWGTNSCIGSSWFSSVLSFLPQDKLLGTSLVVEWLRIHLAVQRMQVWSLVGKLRSHMPRSNQLSLHEN